MIKLIKIGMEPDDVSEHIITPTIFPDKTSQVWKLPEEALRFTEFTQITWEFENESEFIQVLQLADLLSTVSDIPDLYIPYLPYSRQDKIVSNTSTFALNTFLTVLNTCGLFGRIITVDVHNAKLIEEDGRIENIIPNEEINEIIEQENIDLICYPDKGASNRGYDLNRNGFSLDKVRNQLTGEIEGLKLTRPMNLKGLRILIVDDICDGGRTFIEASKLLYSLDAEEIMLYTSHGIYSKGTQVIFDSGITKIFNYKGEVNAT